MNAQEIETQDNSLSWSAWLNRQGFSELFNLQPGIDHPFDALSWLPTPADQSAAWMLFTELRTRITTQPLPHYAGDEATALTSVFKLFEISREIINKNAGGTHFATLTVWILNQCVRPFTAKWHRWSTDGRLSSADVRFEFRAELAELQPKLRSFAQLLAVIAGDATQPQVESIPAVKRDPNDPLWKDLPFGIAPIALDAATTSQAIDAAEAKEVALRRSFYDCENPNRAINATGLAISGGGIRSATFALGVVQQLARKGILQQVDFLSTVSGGGYLGGFISSFLNDKNAATTLKPELASQPFGSDGNSESLGIRQLRNHSKYLAEGGIRTLAIIASLVGYGLLVSLLLLAPILLSAVCLTVYLAPFEGTKISGSLWSSITFSAICVLIPAVLALPLLQRLRRGNWLRQFWEIGCIMIAGLVTALLLADGLVILFNEDIVHKNIGYFLLATIASPLILGIIALQLGANSLGGKLTFALFALFGPLFIVTAYFTLLKTIILHQSSGGSELVLIATIASILYAAYALNINTASPHSFYRNRLARTYLVRSSDYDTALSSIDPQLLSQMNETSKAPYHLINCAINVPASKNPNLRGRNTDFFLFSKHYCGSPISGLHPTTEWEAMDGHLDLGTAIAISGAAAAPHMGTLTSARYTFLLAILNIRLGYWLRKPSKASKFFPRALRVPSLQYYLREITGLMSENSAYINLSDGGHIENLGVYELLRRRCKFVIAIDGEADVQRSFGGLLTLTQLAKIDLGVSIEPDLSDLRIDKDGRGRSHFGLARIRYPGGDQGILLYIKSSLTGNESEFLRKYRQDNPDFPHQSTAQQLFSETQFEAYRELGEHVAKDLFREDLIGSIAVNPTISQWFYQLTSKFGMENI